MRLTFAGAGSAFCDPADNYQSNLVLAVDTPAGTRRLLIDCGSDARFSLPRIGIRDTSEIDAVFISHLHADHVGGLEWLALTTRYAGPSPRRLKLLIPEVIAAPLWHSCLAGGLAISEDGVLTLDDYFDVAALPEGPSGAREDSGTFTWQDLIFSLVAVPHIEGPEQKMRSFGLAFGLGGRRVYFSTDAKFDRDLAGRPYAEQADVIFHDCETGPRTGVHSQFADLCQLPAELREKMWLYHYSAGPLPDARAHGFRGFVQRGQTFDFARPETLLSGAGSL